LVIEFNDCDHSSGQSPCVDLYRKIKSMAGKTDKQFFFEIQLNWLIGTRGILSANDAKGTIHVATPPAFGGEGKPWTPEHLFLSSISSSFMTTYLAFARKNQLNISHFECNIIGQIELLEGRYKFTNINLYPKVYISTEDLREKATLVMEKTHKYCLVSNSVNADIFYHSEVLLDTHPRQMPLRESPPKITYSLEEAREIGDRLGIDFTIYDLAEFGRGLEVEMEHGKKIPESNITNDNEYLTGKIAWAHLREIPDYYTRLDKMEAAAAL
jgi:organic hydroperoxide reductase OsmC/OhrA